MSESFPSRMHRALYGKSDSANAAENDNTDFKSGYEFAMNYDGDSSGVYVEEWYRRGEPLIDTPEFDAYREWKRGFWAARLQKSWIKAKPAAPQPPAGQQPK